VTKTGPGARPMGRVDDGGGGDAVWTLNNSDQPPIHYVQCSYVGMFKSRMARSGFYVCFLVEKHWRILKKSCAPNTSYTYSYSDCTQSIHQFMYVSFSSIGLC